MTILPELLSSKVRSEIFRILFRDKDATFHVREIERQSGFTIGTVQKELKKLEGLDLINKSKDGNRLYYRANNEHPIYPDIRNIVLKTVGLYDILQNALTKNPDIHIDIAFVFGSLANGHGNARSDVDIMIIGDVGLKDVTALLSGVSQQISREINPYVMNLGEYKKRKDEKEHFVMTVSASPKLFVIGNEDDLEKMG